MKATELQKKSFKKYWPKYYAKNKKKKLTQVKAWHDKNKDRRKRNNKEYRSRRRLYMFTARYNPKYGVSISAFDLWKILKKQRMLCALTGRKLTNENISLDHITPVSLGGKTEISNLQFVTLGANRAKGIMSNTELLSLCQDIVKTLLDKKEMSDKILV